MLATRHGPIREGKRTCAWVLWLALLAMAATQAQASDPPPSGEVFARVGERAISFGEYQAALAAGMRKKYFHSKPPVAELSRFQREVADQLIDRVLLLEEARRRGITPERARIDAAIAAYDRRYASSEQWRANRDKMLPALLAQLEANSLLEQLDARVRDVPAPDARAARAYYDTHPDQFTEPEQVRLSLILLAVAPSAPRAAWDQASAEAQRLHKRLQKGADFAELARAHSTDPSAQRGGDLGYLHRGMLPELIEKQVLDALQPGATSGPVVLLEGVAIVRLAERKPARLQPFDTAVQRAGELHRREQGEAAWKLLVAQLRAATVVRVDESRFLPAGAN
ncbi:MAG: peptidylprolyl isomerase [Betaproteobacteria bacterium]|nr:peptidylprolyl isomerase [Betaproteobacteria bacterium]MDH5219761.1 peptidylprolyl isomerase [Betaproteobacteria bacterium]MDH5352513.1 peptidylprolyl isomerase [Betaproteobacteria bacterium]